jgi:hypothetical protein
VRLSNRCKPRRDIFIRIVDDHAEVPLTRGMTALIDIEDIPLVEGRSWNAKYSPITKSYYASTSSRAIRMHRLILGVFDRRQFVDHKDHNTLDNRKKNIRLVSYSESAINRSIQCNNKSGYKHVSFHKGHRKWYVQIKKDGKLLFQKLFKDFGEACRVADEKTREIQGEFYCVS